MHLYEHTKKQHKGLAFAIAVFVLIAGFLLVSLASTTRKNDAREEAMIVSALQRAVVTCYSVEGKYPPSLAYIYDNYGVRVDSSRYAVYYDIVAANLMPSVRVTRIGGGS